MLSQKWVETPLQDEAGHCPEYVDRIHSPSFLAAYSILCVINGYGQGLEASTSEINGDRITMKARAVYLHPPEESERNTRTYSLGIQGQGLEFGLRPSSPWCAINTISCPGPNFLIPIRRRKNLMRKP